MMSYPCPANACAIARPIPRLPPAINAVLPSIYIFNNTECRDSICSARDRCRLSGYGIGKTLRLAPQGVFFFLFGIGNDFFRRKGAGTRIGMPHSEPLRPAIA